VVCRGLDVNLSGKVAKKTTMTRKRGRHAHNVFPPSYHCVRNLSPSTAKAAATEYTHINVAIVTRSHFGNAKPKFHMNCWPTISINDRNCQQRCITGPANILMCTYSFIFTIYKSTWQTAEEYTPVQLSLRTVKHRTKLIIIPGTAYLLLRGHSDRMTSVRAH